MITPSEIDQIIQDILADIPLKEMAIIANLDEDKVPYLQYALDACIRSQIGRGCRNEQGCHAPDLGNDTGDPSVAMCELALDGLR